MPPPPLRKCTKEGCPPECTLRDLTCYCFVCKSPIHWPCYEISKKPEEIFVSDNIVLVCDECLINPKEHLSPKRKQPNVAGNLVQRTIDVQNSTLVLSKSSPVTATPPKGATVKPNQQLQNVIDTLAQKIDAQTNTIAGLQASVDSMKGAVQHNTVAINETIKGSRATYADIAKKVVAPTVTPRSTKFMQTPKTPKPKQKPNPKNPVVVGQSTNVIGKPPSPPKPKIARPKPEKAVWISKMHRDTTVQELTDYVNKATGIPSTDFDVCKLVKKDRDLTTYRFVSFRIGCSQAHFNTIMNPAHWPSYSMIREFDLDTVPSIVERLNPMHNQNVTPKNVQETMNVTQPPDQSAMDTTQVTH